MPLFSKSVGGRWREGVGGGIWSLNEESPPTMHFYALILMDDHLSKWQDSTLGSWSTAPCAWVWGEAPVFAGA